jgi:hypothetical protein
MRIDKNCARRGAKNSGATSCTLVSRTHPEFVGRVFSTHRELGPGLGNPKREPHREAVNRARRGRHLRLLFASRRRSGATGRQCSSRRVTRRHKTKQFSSRTIFFPQKPCYCLWAATFRFSRSLPWNGQHHSTRKSISIAKSARTPTLNSSLQNLILFGSRSQQPKPSRGRFLKRVLLCLAAAKFPTLVSVRIPGQRCASES